MSTVIVQGQGSAYVAQHGEALVSAELSLERLKNSPWLRVTVIDQYGKRDLGQILYGEIEYT